MLIARHNLKGMTLVEILVALAIVIILYAAAAPNFSEWIQNTKIRTAAESIQNGLSLARSEAVHRNVTTQFVTCGGSSWDVIATSAVVASSVVCATPAGAGWASIQRRPGYTSSTTDLVNTTQSTIGFNGLGRQISITNPANGVTTPSPPVAVNIDVSTSVAGTSCYCPVGTCGYPGPIPNASTGKLRCLRISISSGGQVRMCDPALQANTAQGC